MEFKVGSMISMAHNLGSGPGPAIYQLSEFWWITSPIMAPRHCMRDREHNSPCLTESLPGLQDTICKALRKRPVAVKLWCHFISMAKNIFLNTFIIFTQILGFLKFTCYRKFTRFRKTIQVVWKETQHVRWADVCSRHLQTWWAAVGRGWWR